LAGEIVFTNVRANGCTLDGFPRVELRSAGKALDVGVGYIRDPFAAPVLLGPGDEARSVLNWFNWCGGDLPDLEVRFALPNGTTASVATPTTPPEGGGVTTPRCDAPLVESSLGVSVFEPRSRQLPSDPQPARISLHVPAKAVAGRTITYFVTLTNLGDEVASLRPCPYYVEGLIVHGLTLKAAEKQYVMNCEAIGWEIGPGATVLLEMRIAIPSEVAPGPVTLVWRVDPRGPFDAISGIGRTSLEVVAP
jgi:hypothetical protein